MSRRNVVWLLTLPLAIVGSQVAHSLAYRFATDGNVSHELAASGHGYLAYAPLALGVCAALVALALVRELRDLLAGHERASRPSALTFAVLAPFIFVGQEHFERLTHQGAFPTSLLVEKTFVLGLALQLPFALAAYALARLLLRATRAVARLLASPRVPVVHSPSRWEHGSVWTPRATRPALTLGPRGPPSPLVV
jgi:hypothetical protein